MHIVIKWLTIPAASAYFYNDILVIISLLGSIVLFLGSFAYSPFRHFTKLAEWHIAPLVFGTFFQISFILVGLVPETNRMGLLVPMRPGLINALFGLSFLLVVSRWWLKRNQSGLIQLMMLCKQSLYIYDQTFDPLINAIPPNLHPYS